MWKSHKEGSGLYRRWSNILQHTDCSMSWTAWATWGRAWKCRQLLQACQGSSSWWQYGGFWGFHSCPLHWKCCQCPWTLILSTTDLGCTKVPTPMVVQSFQQQTRSPVGREYISWCIKMMPASMSMGTIFMASLLVTSFKYI